ncbi:MAG: phosphomannomutase, partial [Planktomarina sp.]|nr:phosphomannomutase [Planktomarina sp.]
MKIVKSGSRPLDDIKDFKKIKTLAENAIWDGGLFGGNIEDVSVESRTKYVDQCLGFVDVAALKPLRIVVNCGNGAAGPTFDAIADALINKFAPIKFIRVHHKPDHTFPNGIPNPLLPENHPATGDVVVSENADFGVAFDG